MSPTDLRLLCTALGFVAVMGQESDLNAEKELRITTTARTIEAFCINQVPDGIHRDGHLSKRVERLYRLSDAIVRIMQRAGDCKKKDLVAAGFRETDVKHLWSLAYRLAKTQLRMSDT